MIWECRQGILGMGVADGVYQWREQGIDAGEFSRLLMQTALEAVEEGQPDVLKGQAMGPVPVRFFTLTCLACFSFAALHRCPSRQLRIQSAAIQQLSLAVLLTAPCKPVRF